MASPSLPSAHPVVDEERIRPLVGVSASSFLQSFDTVGWVA